MRTPVGILALAALTSGLCGLFLHPQAFVVSLGVLIVTTVGLVWPWLSVRGLSGSVSLDRVRCRERQPVATRLTLRNRMPWSVWGVSIKEESDEQHGAGAAEVSILGLAVAPGWRTTVHQVDFVPECRGVYPRRPPRIVCGFPFGLWEARRPLEVTAPLLVWPRTLAVAPLPAVEGGHSLGGLAVRDRAGNWGDPLGVRPYRRGDPLRRVHWAQTARHRQLIVCEVQSNTTPRVQIVLDVQPSVHAGRGVDGSREWAIRVAASLAEGWIGQRAEVELVFDGGFLPARGGSARAQSTAVLDALARIPPGGDRSLAEVLSLPECRRFDRGLRVVVTTDVGLSALTGPGFRRAGDRFIVLTARGFGGDELDGHSVPISVVPWVRIDSPQRVAACLLLAGKEVTLGR